MGRTLLVRVNNSLAGVPQDRVNAPMIPRICLLLLIFTGCATSPSGFTITGEIYQTAPIPIGAKLFVIPASKSIDARLTIQSRAIADAFRASGFSIVEASTNCDFGVIWTLNQTVKDVRVRSLGLIRTSGEFTTSSGTVSGPSGTSSVLLHSQSSGRTKLAPIETTESLSIDRLDISILTTSTEHPGEVVTAHVNVGGLEHASSHLLYSASQVATRLNGKPRQEFNFHTPRIPIDP